MLTISSFSARVQIDMVVAARALAELRLVSVFALIPPPTTTTRPQKRNLAISQLPVVRSEHVRTFFDSTQSWMG